DNILFPGQEGVGTAKADILFQSGMFIKSISLEFSGANPKECNPISMPWIEIGVDFKDKAGEFIFFGANNSFVGLPWLGWRRYSDKGIQQFLYPEIIDGRTEE